MSSWLRARNYNSPEIQAIVDKWEAERPALEAEWRRLEAIMDQKREQQRAKSRARRAQKAEWTAGVAKIMAEVRRRETVRAIAEFGL